ncbi:MAG TPA: ABC transporter substrate-binding protein [Sinomonas sp.]|nr:ABC transporter substrate-binding protein [Sinomonas sp.]
MTSFPEMSRRSLVKGILVAGSAAVLVGCGDTGTTSGSSPSASGEAGGGSGPITIKDQRGKTLTFERPVTSVVTIPMPAASLLVAVDESAAHLSAMHSASWTAMRTGIMGTMFPNALKIPHDIAAQDFTPNVESIRALNPDVVIQWSDAQLTAPLEDAGLKVVGFNNTGSEQDVEAWTALFAQMLGKPQRAAQLQARSNDELHQVQSLAKGRTAGPRVLYFNRFVGGLKVAASGTYNDFYIRLVGAQNAAVGPHGAGAAALVGVDVEQVLAWDPEIILLGNFDAALPKDVYTNSVWQSVSAVRNRRVYKVPLGGYRWDPPGQESPLMWHWLSDVSYPQPHSDLRAKIVDYYRLLYSYEPTTGQMDGILWRDANASSADYAQFLST